MKVLPTPPRLLQNAMECVGAIVLGAAGVRPFSLCCCCCCCCLLLLFPLDEEGVSEAVRAVSRERESGEGVGGSRTGRGATTRERGWVAVWLRRAARMGGAFSNRVIKCGITRSQNRKKSRLAHFYKVTEMKKLVKIDATHGR